MFTRLTTVIATICVFSSAVIASGQIAQVIDASNFCVFLPPSSETDRNIADTEWDANAFCMGTTTKATGADKLPSGFITSAHYVATDAYVQVTGMMDYTKANLNGSDEGGQYDIKAPVGSSCAGWSYYVNLIEPVSNTYCIRCCNDTVNCNRGISEKGCAHIIPGDYSGPGDTSSTITAAVTTTAAAATATTDADTTTTDADTTTTDSATTTTDAATTTTAAATTTTAAATTITAAASTTSITTSSATSTVYNTTSAANQSAASSSSAITSDSSVHAQSANAADSIRPYGRTLIVGALISTLLFH